MVLSEEIIMASLNMNGALRPLTKNVVLADTLSIMNISTYTVKPKLPASLKSLDEIARNLWLAWNYDAIQLFIRLDFESWTKSNQSPVKMLGMVSQTRLHEMEKDDSYIAYLNEVYDHFQHYKKTEGWYRGAHKDVVAYFSMEYGMDVSLPVYSGGLGMLSGDHMKTSSDMNLPLVGVGLLYKQGYFIQHINADGFQQEVYPVNDWYNMPVELKKDKDGKTLYISVDLAGRECFAQVWEVKVGRASLFLLDTNNEKNKDEDLKEVTAALYGGDKETRIRQEIVLGIGGIRALRALGINPAATHMNEGHAAFLILERARELIAEKQFTLDQAFEAIWPTNIFTTHTPVPAGNERFELDLLKKYMNPWTSILGISWDDFLGFGRIHKNDAKETFCMTVLALRFAAYANGVSALHGAVSRDMWKDLWPGLPIDEVPIGHVTNGVHPRTWISSGMCQLLDRYFGPKFEDEPASLSIWDRMDRISDEELWRAHERRREQLVVFARNRLKQMLTRNGAPHGRMQQAEDALSPSILTISFARRFATYKRGTLLFRDPERLIRLLKNNEQPVQLIFAGQAHPADIPGKELIREIVHFAKEHDVENRIIFLENYDMTMSRYLVSGSDVWLNTPTRPLEASGTSGMKASMNGVLNCSILDGWWDEACNSGVGWAIGHGEEYSDVNLQNDIESKSLYDLLEREIIPLFYQRGRDGLPREWIKMMKNCMREIGQSMSSHRMLMDYSNKFYFPALKNYRRVTRDDYAETRAVAVYFEKLKKSWDGIRIISIDSTSKKIMQRGDFITVTAHIDLGELKEDEVLVELYHGEKTDKNFIVNARRAEMRSLGREDGACKYQVRVECTDTGLQGHTIRILPKHNALVTPYRPGFVKWAY
jgi:starch phosphorylase